MTEPPPYPPPPPPDAVGGAGQDQWGSPRGPSGPRAGFWTRFAAVVVDSILLALVNTVLAGVLGSTRGLGLSVVVSFIYYGYMEGGPSGQTVGKKVLDIRVVQMSDGGPLGWGTALLRHLCSYLSSLPCLLGYFWMLWDDEKQTWHDKLSSTVVVPTEAWPPPPDSFAKPPST